jgi:hypothetical protein
MQKRAGVRLIEKEVPRKRGQMCTAFFESLLLASLLSTGLSLFLSRSMSSERALNIRQVQTAKQECPKHDA